MLASRNFLLCGSRDLELPITWSASHDIVVYKDHMKAELDAILSLQADSDDTKNITLKKNLLQMKFQSLSYQKAKHLLSSHDSKELNLPCQVEDEQLEIILFPTSAFIMGRPGCGKTAALTIKLFMREQQQIHPGGCSEVTRQNAEVSYRNEGGEECKEIDRTVLRQLFITVTLKQCLAVKEHLSYLKRFVQTSGTSLRVIPSVKNALDSAHFYLLNFLTTKWFFIQEDKNSQFL